MGSDKLLVFLSSWAMASIWVLVLSSIFKSQIVFGNMDVAGPMAAVVWSGLFTFLGYFSPRLASKLELKIKDERVNILITTILLIPVIWLVKKLAVFTGLGISNNLFVLLLAFSVSIVLFYSLKYSEQYLKKI